MKVLRLCIAVVASLALPAVAGAQLVGVDFNTGTGTTPPNWNSLTTPGSVANLTSDAGAPTGWSFAVTGGNGFTFATVPGAATVPTHTYPLSGLDDYLTGGGNVTGTARFSNLPALTPFNVYAFGLRGFAPLSMDWTVTGDNAITFTQSGGAQELWVNGEVGSSSRTLGSYARVVTSSANGTIDFTYDPFGAANIPFAVAGLAIQVVPEPGSLALLACCGALVLRRARR